MANPNELDAKTFDQLVGIMLKKGYLVENDGEITTAKEPPENEPFTRAFWHTIHSITTPEGARKVARGSQGEESLPPGQSTVLDGES